jgi:hypothetical protein
LSEVRQLLVRAWTAKAEEEKEEEEPQGYPNQE